MSIRFVAKNAKKWWNSVHYEGASNLCAVNRPKIVSMLEKSAQTLWYSLRDMFQMPTNHGIHCVAQDDRHNLNRNEVGAFFWVVLFDELLLLINKLLYTTLFRKHNHRTSTEIYQFSKQLYSFNYHDFTWKTLLVRSNRLHNKIFAFNKHNHQFNRFNLVSQIEYPSGKIDKIKSNSLMWFALY